MSELSDKELFESAISDTPIETEAPAEQPVAEAVSDGPARDDKGRFAPKEAPEAPAIEAKPVEAKLENEAHVPSWRLREVNEAREAAERRSQEAHDRAVRIEQELAALRQAQQKLQEPVDPWSDLPGYLQQSQSTLDQRIAQIEQRANLRASKAEAIAIHGRDAVAEMEKAIEAAMRSGHPEMQALSVQMQRSDDPVGAAMQWYQRDKLLKETGGDLNAYRTKALDEALKDPAFLAKALEAAKAQASGQPGKLNSIVQLPPSINRATSAGSPHEEGGDLTDRSLYQYATR